MRCTQLVCHVLVHNLASLKPTSQNLSLIVCAIHVFAMSTRRSSRRTRPPIKLTDYELDDLLEASATPQQISRAVKCELSQVDSMIKDLSPTNGKAEQPTVKQDRTIEDLRNHNLQLELDLTRTKLELLKLQRESARNSPSKMVAADQSRTSGDNPTAKPTLKDLHQDSNLQSELKSLMDSLGEPVLDVGLTEEEQDPARQLLEPTSSRGKVPLLIPDFISSLPIILQEDRETVLGTSGDAKIILKSSQEKKPSLDKISFPQWSAANFRIMHILMRDGLLSSTQDIFDYILYSSKISELPKCYPLSKVMRYDDLYRRMQFDMNCTWGTDSQFISHQTLHRPDSLTATTNRPVPPCKPSRPVINPVVGKQVCYDFQRCEGCRFGSSCTYDHVCIKPQCLGTHPQFTFRTPNSKPALSHRDFSKFYLD